MSIGPKFGPKNAKIRNIGPNFGRRYVWATDRTLLSATVHSCVYYVLLRAIVRLCAIVSYYVMCTDVH